MARSTYTPARGPGVTTAQAQTRGLLGTQSRTSRGLDLDLLDLDLFASRPVNLQPIASRDISRPFSSIDRAVRPTQPSDLEASTPSETRRYDDVLYIPRQPMGRTGRFNSAEQESATVAEEHSSSQTEQSFSANTSGKLYKPCVCVTVCAYVPKMGIDYAFHYIVAYS